MKFFDFYKDVLNCNNEDEVFAFLLENLKSSNHLWSYFVDWEKVDYNLREIEISLNLLNYLIGKKDFNSEFKILLRTHPQIVKVLPILLACREKSFDVLVDFSNKKLTYENYDFSKEQILDTDIERYLNFVKNVGLKDAIFSGRVKSLVDYVLGVEVGLDSNGRKNRGGHSMEFIVESFVKDLCFRKSYEYLKEANAEKIYEAFNIRVPVDKSSRRYDYVVKTPADLLIFEVNFYGGGGSKLKSTAGEYRNLYDVLKNRFKFIWITDGVGWLGTSRPLRETFDHNDYVFSLSMIEHGILDFV